MILKDYHLHTNFSSDSQQTLDTLILQARSMGLKEICVTDHLDTGHPDPGVDKPIDPVERHAAFEKARAEHPELILREGLEIGAYHPKHEEILAYLKRYPLDYHLLSMHLVNGVDPYKDPSWPRPSYHDGKTRAESYRIYLQCLLSVLKEWKPEDYDALAHIGYVGKFSPFEDKILRYEDGPEELDEILKILILNGKALEINTSTIPITGEPMASLSVLRRYRELGGELVVFGSDGHRPDKVGQCFPQALEMAREIGFRYAASFEKRVLKPYSIA